MTEEHLAAIKRRVGAASPGPWEFRDNDGVWKLVMPGHGIMEVQMCDEQYYPWTPSREEDWSFIAHARQDIQDLLEEVERLRKELRGVKNGR